MFTMRLSSTLFVCWSLLSSALLSAAGFEMATVEVGSKLQTSITFKLNEPAPDGGLEVTLKSEDPSRLKLARRPDVAGSESIVMTIQAGFSESPDFWVQGFASSGEVGYTATAKTLGASRGVVKLMPSSILMVGPFKAQRFRNTTGGQNSRLVLYAARLNAAGEFAEQQSLAGGLKLDLKLSNSAPEVGVISPPIVTIEGGQPNGVAEFKPASAGTVNLAVVMPEGFNPPPANYAGVSGVITLPGISLTDQVMIGQNLQLGGMVGLGEAAGPAGVQVTITSDDETQLLISSSATTVGKKSLVVTIPPNGISAPYFLQALGKSGTVTYTAVSKGFRSRMAKVGLAPSGVVIAPRAYGPPDEAELFKKGQEGARGFIIHLSKKGAKMPMAIWTAQLDPVTLRSADITVQPLRAGVTLNLDVEVNDPAIGKVTKKVEIKPGTDMGVAEFTPLAKGTAIISVITPNGFTKSANSTSVEGIVKD
ncbi:MAG: hypothetical protein K2X03_00215 [Bryobacteraceae bacterium]|nr:hypothetical protein [Bryobacteraceae bacterium]